MCFFNIFLLLIISINAHSHSSDSCLSSNETYALCSLTSSHPLIKSKSFTKDDFHHQCQEEFAHRILTDKCRSIPKQRTPPTVLQKYLYGFSAVFIVSALSLAGLLAFPIIYKASFQYVLTLFTALAVGTLFGDTMFHLIPFALGLHVDHDDDDHQRKTFSVPEYVWKMLVSVLILYSFYLLEVLLHSFAHYKHKNSSSVHFHAHGHSHTMAHHNHSHVDGKVCADPPLDIDADLEHGHRLHNHRHHNLHQHVANEISTASSLNNAGQSLVNKNNSMCVPCAYSNEIRRTTIENPEQDEQIQVMLPENQPKKSSQDSNENVASPSGVEHAMKSTGWMVLIGDGIHNFADGLAIGAAFSQDLVLGMTTTLAVAFHELPHELGDYAVLIQSGFSHYRAILWNFLSATTAVIGFFIGVALSSDEKIRQWIFAVTVGMFLYISLVDLLPTLLADGQVEWKRFLVVNIGFLLGITIMFLLALFEDSLIHSSH